MQKVFLQQNHHIFEVKQHLLVGFIRALVILLSTLSDLHIHLYIRFLITA